MLFASTCFPFFSFSQNYIFAQLKGTPLNTAGWNLQGAARVGNITGTDNSELIICDLTGASGAVFYNQPINLSLCHRWKAEFDFRMFDGTGADGFSFCFLDVPPVGFITGGGLGIPSSANGLKVCFDTWNNCIDFNAATVHKDMPKVELRWGVGYDECASQPTKTNMDSSISYVRAATYNHAKVTYDNGNIEVYVNDNLLLTGYQQFNYDGYLGFTASTGGYSDNHSVKNVVIYTEMPPSKAGSSGVVTFCPNGSAQLGVPNNPTYLYAWSPAAGLSAVNVSNPFVTLNNNDTVSQNHTYYVKTSYSDNPGCSSIDSVIVKVYPRPVVNFLTPEICLNDAVAQFKDSSFSGEATLTPFTYQWNFGDPNANTLNPNTSTVKDAAHLYSAAANYNVKLAVTNNKGCVDSLTTSFTVNGAVPKAAFTVNGQPPFCNNGTVTITNSSTVNFGNITRIVIAWGDSIGVLHIDENPSAGKQYSHHYPANQNSAAVNYSILYIAYSGNSCFDNISRTISILQSPAVVFDKVPSVCSNEAAFKLTQATETTGLPGAFTFTGDAVSSDGWINPQAGPGTYQLQATYTANNTCRDSATLTHIIDPLPTANAGPDLFILKGGSSYINGTATGTDLRYLWQPPVYLDNDTILHPMITPVNDTSYLLTVTGVGGCKAKDSLNVVVLENPNIPNAFTPNGDGINDVWKIRYLDTYNNCEIDIYNRYGEHVFHSTGYATPWDGRYKGKPLPVGAYTYIVNTKKHIRPFVGQVIIFR